MTRWLRSRLRQRTLRREGILQLNGEMMEMWRVELEKTWALSTPIPKKVAEAYWRLKNGIERALNKIK